jgi:predicted MPP superfamily phosphohydrolase
MKFIMFTIAFILVIGLASWYVARQLLDPAKLHRRGKIIAVSAIAYIVLATPVTVMFRSFGIENLTVDIMAWFGYTGLGFLSFVFTFLVIRDSIRLLSSAVLKFRKRFVRKAVEIDENSETLDHDRRRFLLNGINTGILASAGVFTGYGVAEAKQIPDVKNVPIPIQGLPADLNGFRIVQITDIHVSPTIKRNFVQGVVDVVNSLSADMVVLTGDLVDGSVKRLAYDVDPLKQVRSKHGNFFVTGNHEYYSGALPWIDKVRDLGFTVLLNENQLVSHGSGRILIAGVTDYRAGSFYRDHESDPIKAMAGAPPANIKILLAHQPKSIFEAAKAGFDLQISGHTHGGQFYPWNLFAGLAQPFVKGLHRYQNTQIYISGGTGYWGPPVRLGSPSEITLITLVAA